MKFKYVNCNICGSSSTKVIGKRCPPDKRPDLETDIVQCATCGLMYPNPMPRMERDELQKNFDNPNEYFSGEINEGRIRKYEKALRLIEKNKPEKGSLLDVGCGRGELVSVANRRNWRAAGTEISESFARQAREKFKVSVFPGNITDMELPQEAFDAISLSSVIQYVQDPMGTLRKINSLLKKDGILYIEVTNEDAFVFKVGDFFKSITSGKKLTSHLSPLFPSFQIYGFNKKSLSLTLEKSGFEILYFKVKGIRGGGKLKGRSITYRLVSFMRKAVIAAGGMTGNGHLIYCVARKKENK